MKPGYKTTEFVATALMVIGTVLTYVLGHAVDLTPYVQPVATVVSGVCVAAYAVSRGLVKAKVVPESKVDPIFKVVDQIDPTAEAELARIFATE